MASKNCKFKSFFECYGHFPLQNRHDVDQVPLELNRRDFTLEVRGTTDPVHIRGHNFSCLIQKNVRVLTLSSQ